jgi:hypothetical protein
VKKELESEKYILVYGLSKIREHYRTTNTRVSEKVKFQAGHQTGRNEYYPGFHIDSYNNEIKQFFAGFSPDLHNKKRYEEVMETWHIRLGRSTRIAPSFLWEKYHEATKTKEKFMFENIFPHSKFKPGTKYEIYSEELHDTFIKRGCKIGIEAVKLSDNIEIWFLLDGLEIEQVVNKSKEGFTNSELRYIYRNWKELEEKVVFLCDDRRVSAPWEKNPELWQSYETKLASKNEARNPKQLKDLIKAGERSPVSPPAKEQENKVDFASAVLSLKKRLERSDLDVKNDGIKTKTVHSR